MGWTEVRPRPARACDLPAIESIERDCFARPWPLDELQRELGRQQPQPALYVVQPGTGQLAAYACWRWFGCEAELLRIACALSQRGSGHARSLLEHGLARARSSSCDRVFLEVAAGNQAAIGLYASVGFQHVGVRKGYYPAAPGGGPEDAWMMARELV